MQVGPSLLSSEEFRQRVDTLLRWYGEAEGKVGLIDDLPHPEAVAYVPLSKVLKAGRQGNGEVSHVVQIEILARKGEWWTVLWLSWPGTMRRALLYRVAPKNLPFLRLLADSRRIYLRDTRSDYGTIIEEIPVEALATALAVYQLLPVEAPP